jgi:uncharacterized membrane protein YqhA
MHGVLGFLLGLRAIMLIGSAGAMVGALLMFLQGSSFLYHAWFDFFAGQQVVVPVLEAVDAFLFGIVLVIFAYGIAIGFVFSLPEGYGRRLPNWMKVEGVGQLKATLAEVVIVVLIVIFARVVVGTVELDKPFDWPMLVLPASILLIAAALRMIELGARGSHNAGQTDAGGGH